jgi:hypothetical protein
MLTIKPHLCKAGSILALWSFKLASDELLPPVSGGESISRDYILILLKEHC